mmetsp:Transcript_8113/g.15726  ORF Transcript_8113/g.15726 Transcript_8113/m.15726 type:complete len:87 (+) Transcript_8113:356-616(+)
MRCSTQMHSDVRLAGHVYTHKLFVENHELQLNKKRSLHHFISLCRVQAHNLKLWVAVALTHIAQPRHTQPQPSLRRRSQCLALANK